MNRLQDRTTLLTPRITQIWNQALEAPLDRPSTWLHGDLHPRNVLVNDGVISGIIDWGDLTSGDCATDLASVWMLFGEPHAQRAALVEYGGVSEATCRRAKGWAVLLGVVMLDTGLIDNPRNAALGERILRQVAEGE
jgi:aminoglycoside phosphotransferase (APT) family kinase protein